MKTARRDQVNKQNKQLMSKKPRPEIRDNLDSRAGEEQEYKGDDITHNEKYERNNKQKKQS
jgi:hypothetical protein